jgi:hypothetical protein
MRETTLSGSFYEMGRQYGSLLKGKIKSFLFMTRLMAVASEGEGRDFFRPKYRHMLGGLFRMRAFKRAYREVAEEFEVAIARYYPEILDMIKGISEAVGVDHRDVIFMNCLLEYSLKCSAFGATGSATKEGKPLIGMNADESKSVQTYYMVIHFKPDEGLAFTAVYVTGMIFPVFGMNEAGLAVASKALFLNNDAIDKIRLPFFLKLSVPRSTKPQHCSMASPHRAWEPRPTSPTWRSSSYRKKTHSQNRAGSTRADSTTRPTIRCSPSCSST